MSYGNTWGAQDAFDRYEAIRHRMPGAAFPEQTQNCAGLLDIADRFDAFVLDSFGVLNVGERAIPGAVDCLRALRGMGKRLIVLTNAASYTRDVAVARYRKLGFDFAPQEVVSSLKTFPQGFRTGPGRTWMGSFCCPALPWTKAW